MFIDIGGAYGGGISEYAGGGVPGTEGGASKKHIENIVTVNNNSSFQNYTNPVNHTQQTTDTPGFKPFTILYYKMFKEMGTI